MKLERYFFYFVIASCFTSSGATAQATNDSSFTAMAINHAIDDYHRLLNKSTGLYNGSQYGNYNFRFEEGDPYFIKDSVSGTVYYDGIFYRGVFMKYDEVKDALVMWNNNDAIRLIDERVKYFTLGDHAFIRVIKEEASKNPLTTGFYEQLYKGRTSVLKKVTKKIIEKPDINEGLLRSIDPKTSFYLETSQGYIEVDGKSGVLNALKDHKNQLKDFIRSNKLAFKQDPAVFLVKVAAYYDTL